MPYSTAFWRFVPYLRSHTGIFFPHAFRCYQGFSLPPHFYHSGVSHHHLFSRQRCLPFDFQYTPQYRYAVFVYQIRPPLYHSLEVKAMLLTILLCAFLYCIFLLFHFWAAREKYTKKKAIILLICLIAWFMLFMIWGFLRNF